MRTLASQSRLSFYQNESDEGSHLSPAYNQDVLSELLSALDKKSIERIADIGSGSGLNIPTLARHFAEADIVTLDLSGRALIQGRHTSRAVLPAQSDAAAIPLRDGTVDLVICTEVLEHVADMTRVFVEMQRILKPDGHAIVSSPNYLNAMGVRKWLNDRKRGESFWDPWGGHPGYERLMLPSSMRKALEPHFTVMMVRGAGYLMGWVPLGYRRIGNANDRFPFLWIGRLPLLKHVAMNRYLLLARKSG